MNLYLSLFDPASQGYTRIGTIDYDGLIPAQYDDRPFWLGCGNLYSPNDKAIGSFEYDLTFTARRAFSIDQINDITQNYKLLKNINITTYIPLGNIFFTIHNLLLNFYYYL